MVSLPVYPALLQRPLQIGLCTGVVRIDTKGLLKVINGLLKFSPVEIDHRQIVMGLFVIGVHPQRLPVVIEGFVVFANPGQYDTEIVVGTGMVRLEPNRFLQGKRASAWRPLTMSAAPRLLWASA